MIKRYKNIGLVIFNLIALAAFIGLFAYGFKSKSVMTSLFAHVSYYLIFLLVLLWFVEMAAFLRNEGFSLKSFPGKYWKGILFAFLLTTLIFVSVRVKFKTLSDETNLLAISRSMLNNKTCFNSTMGKFYYGNLNDINNEIPKRPLVFPFGVNLLHTLTGFRYQNAFALNFIILFLFLSGVYIGASKLLDTPSSLAAMLFIISYPVVTIFSTSGGFDLLNSVFFFLILFLVYYLIKKPTVHCLAFLFVSLLVFGNIRYESIVFLVITPVLVIIPLLLLRKIKWPLLKDCSYLFFLTPLLSLPYIWQRILRHDAYQNPDDVSVLSAGAFVRNVKIFFVNIIDLDYFLPYAGVLSVVSIAIFIFLTIEVVRKRKSLKSDTFYFIIVAALLIFANSMIYFTHFFGDCTHPSSARFFIILSIIFALGPIALKVAKPGWVSGRWLLILSVASFLIYHPIAVEGRFINALKGNRVTEESINLLSEIKNKNILVIAERPGQFASMGYGAVNFSYANQHKGQLLKEIDRSLFAKVIVIQEIEYKTQKPTKQTALDNGYELNGLYEVQVSATEFLRISEVKML